MTTTKPSTRAKLAARRPTRTKAAAATATAAPARKSEAAPKAPPRPLPKPSSKASPLPKPRKEKKVHGTYAMPESDYARIARLKAAVKTDGIKVKKNELFRLGLQALQATPLPELCAAIITMRRSAGARTG